MSVPIKIYPDPFLKTPAKEVLEITPEIAQHIDNMIHRMQELPRCVGLAAVQVGIPWKIAVLDASAHPKTTQSHGLLVLVNPVLKEGEGRMLLREGCASVPDFTGNVRRYKKVAVSFWDRHGTLKSISTEGFEAAVVQHELDHLNGLLFLDRLAGLKDLFERKDYGSKDSGSSRH